MRKFFFCLTLAFASAPAAADIVYLNKGDEISGTVGVIDDGSVKITAAGKERSFARKDVMKIQFVREYDSGAAEPMKDPEIAGVLAKMPDPKDYPNDGYITWLNDVNIVINPDRSWTLASRGIRVILRERGKSPAAYLSHTYLPPLQTAGIDYAYSITDSTVSYLNDISVMEGSPNMAYPSYDRIKLVKYAIPNVQTGSLLAYKSHYSTVYASTYPFFADIAFRYFEPVRIARLTVTVPDSLALVYSGFNLPKSAVFSRTAGAGNSIYSWEIQDMPSYRREPNSPPFMRYSPQVMLSLAGSWEELRAALAPLLRDRLTITPAMKAEAEKIISGKNSDLERAEALYNWVAKEIKYLPVDFDEYSYLPKPADETFTRKTGNALDKSFLLYALCESAGLKPQFAYVRSKYVPFAENLPNIRQFDYAECLLEAGGKMLTLAPVNDTHRYFELPSQLQGARAFRVLGPGEPLLTNPDHPADQEAESSVARYTLDKEGNLSGVSTSRMTGGVQADMRAYKNYKKEDLDRDMEKYAHSIHPLARLKSYRLENLDDLSKDLDFSVSMDVSGYAMKAGKYMIFKVPGLQYSASDAAQTERELPLFWYSRSRASRSLEIKLPDGYRLYHAPKDLDIKLAGQSYKAGFKASAGRLAFTEDLKMENTWVSPEDYGQYKAFKQAMAEFSENWIVLEKK